MTTSLPNACALAMAIAITLPACTPTTADPSDAGTGGHDAAADGARVIGDDAAVPGHDADRSDAGFPEPTTSPAPMPWISQGVPAFATSGDPVPATDDVPTSCWAPTSLPASLTFDVSGANVDGAIYVAWYAIHAGAWLADPSSAGDQFPTDYTIEINEAPSAASPPTSGWTEITSVTGNVHGSRGLLANAPGAHWVRMTVTAASGGSTPCIDLDVHTAPQGASDAFLFMGDSITHMTFVYAFSDFRTRVRAGEAGRWPALFEAAIGGTNTGTALEVIDQTMADFDGRYVVLAYGTNDHADGFRMNELIDHVLASGRIPVVPHMPWSSGSPEGAAINAQIDAIYAARPEVLRGPDLWAAFENRTDLIPVGDVHPNDAGRDVLRQTWADWLVSLPQP